MSVARPTLVHIARRARVSVMTVSRALRGRPGVSPEVARRINRIAGAIGYQPNPLVQALMVQVRTGRANKSAHTIGLLLPQVNDPQWGRQEWIRRCVSGAEERARAAGFHLEVFKWPRAEMSDDRMDQILKARGIRGLVIAPMTSPGGEIRLDWNHYAAAAVGATVHFPRLHRVRHDAFHSIQTALARLRAAGCRQIGLALSMESAARVTYFWEAGFVHALDVREMPARAQLIYRPERFEPDGLVRWVRGRRLDGLLIPDHRCYTWLCEAGLAIPGEIAVAALNRYGQPAELAGIDQQLGALGAATVDLVVEQYQRGEFGIPSQPKDVLMGGAWVDGRTVRAPRAATARVRTSRTSSAPRSVRKGVCR